MSLVPELKRISFQYNFRQAKKLSQSFLVDERVLAREAKSAEVEGKKVLEVGPGFGFLTRALLYHNPGELVLVEKDARLIPVLESELSSFKAGVKLQVINCDFLELRPMPNEFDVVVSNVPYAISSPFLFKLAGIKFRRAVLCLQKEFVERMLAKPGTREYSRLSVTSQACFEVRLLERVPRTAFSPHPKVDSAIIELIPTGGRLGAETDRLVQLLFQHRKKTVNAALSDSAEMLGKTKGELRASAEKSGLAGRRVFTLSRQELEAISSLL